MNVNTRQDDTGVVKGNFRSCTLVRPGEDNVSVLSQTCLIPEKYAKAGRSIEVNSDGQWISWMVLTASPSVVTDPVDPKVLIKSHRRATGDSMKRVVS